MSNLALRVSERDQELFYEAQLLRDHFPFLLSSTQKILDDLRWEDTPMQLGIGGIAPVGFHLTLGEMLHAWEQDLLVLDDWPELGRVYILGFGGHGSGSMEWRGCTAQGRLVFGGNMRKRENPELEHKRLHCGGELAPDLDVGGLRDLYQQYRSAGAVEIPEGWDIDDDTFWAEYMEKDECEPPASLHDLLKELGLRPEPYSPIQSIPEPEPVPEPEPKRPVLLKLWPDGPPHKSRMSGGSCWGNEWPEDVD
jgi:hypothetical protein